MIAEFPLVTCLMPTADRRRFAGHAIDCFLRQDYPNLELLVVDDGRDAVQDVLPQDPRIRYVRMETRLPIGTKRNAACAAAAGDVIVHWDDDDWSASWRVSYQVRALVESGADVCGLRQILFYEPGRARAWHYVYPAEGRPWAHGATLCYTARFWRSSPFPDIPVGEDTRFVWNERARRVLCLDDFTCFVGTIHAANTSPKQTGDRRWRACTTADIERTVGPDWEGYNSAVGGGA